MIITVPTNQIDRPRMNIHKTTSILSKLMVLIILFLARQVSAVEADNTKDASKKVNHNVISTEVFNTFHQCEKKFKYEVYFLQQNVGYLQRTTTWHPPKGIEGKELVGASINSSSEVSFLFLSSTYQQQSEMAYSFEKNAFLTSRFSQKLTGLQAREMGSIMSADGLSSTVTLDGEVFHHQNEKYPLYDLDTLGSQIRLNLLQEKKQFTLFRQGSDEIKPYHFEVVGLEVINHKVWGELTTIKVIEVGDHKGTSLWFSIKKDYQLVKAKLDLIFSPTVWLTHFEKNC